MTEDKVSSTKLRITANNAIKLLELRGNTSEAKILENGQIFISDEHYDNWNGGTTHLTLGVRLKVEDYVKIEKTAEDISSVIQYAMETFFDVPNTCISKVFISPVAKPLLLWSHAYPYDKDRTIKLLKGEKQILSDALKEGNLMWFPEVESEEIHTILCRIADSVGFELPVKFATARSWLQNLMNRESDLKMLCSCVETRYDEVIAFLLTTYEESDHIIKDGFDGIENRSAYLSDAVSRVTEAIAGEKYTDAVMYANTAVQACLRDVLKSHSITFKDDETNSTLFSKLNGYYESITEQKNQYSVKLLKAATNIIVTVNDIRNHNTFAHANEKLVCKREAKLALNAMSSVMGYLIEVEHDLEEKNELLACESQV